MFIGFQGLHPLNISIFLNNETEPHLGDFMHQLLTGAGCLAALQSEVIERSHTPGHLFLQHVSCPPPHPQEQTAPSHPPTAHIALLNTQSPQHGVMLGVHVSSYGVH